MSHIIQFTRYSAFRQAVSLLILAQATIFVKNFFVFLPKFFCIRASFAVPSFGRSDIIAKRFAFVKHQFYKIRKNFWEPLCRGSRLHFRIILRLRSGRSRHRFDDRPLQTFRRALRPGRRRSYAPEGSSAVPLHPGSWA